MTPPAEAENNKPCFMLLSGAGGVTLRLYLVTYATGIHRHTQGRCENVIAELPVAYLISLQEVIQQECAIQEVIPEL